MRDVRTDELFIGHPPGPYFRSGDTLFAETTTATTTASSSTATYETSQPEKISDVTQSILSTDASFGYGGGMFTDSEDVQGYGTGTTGYGYYPGLDTILSNSLQPVYQGNGGLNGLQGPPPSVAAHPQPYHAQPSPTQDSWQTAFTDSVSGAGSSSSGTTYDHYLSAQYAYPTPTSMTFSTPPVSPGCLDTQSLSNVTLPAGYAGDLYWGDCSSGEYGLG
jgi:hypothetical protein